MQTTDARERNRRGSAGTAWAIATTRSPARP